jgi:hypothetical protein
MARMDAQATEWYRRDYLARYPDTSADGSSSSGGNLASAAGIHQGLQVDSLSPVAAAAAAPIASGQEFSSGSSTAEDALAASTPQQGAASTRHRRLRLTPLQLPAESLSGTEPVALNDAAAGYGDHHFDASPGSGMFSCSSCKAGSPAAKSTRSGDKEGAADEAADVCGHGRAELDSPAGYSPAAAYSNAACSNAGNSPAAFRPAAYFELSPTACRSAGHIPMAPLQVDDEALLGQSSAATAAAAARGVAYDSEVPG